MTVLNIIMAEIPYMEVEAFMDGQETIEPLVDRIRGRYSAEDIVNPETGEVIVPVNTLITPIWLML